MKRNYMILALLFSFVVLSLSFTSALTVTSVTTNPSEIKPGETAKIAITIKNIFNYDISNVNVKLDLSGDIPFAPYQSSSEEYVDELNEGDRETFDFDIIALPNAADGIYKLPLEIRYEDENGNISTKNELISVAVGSSPELSFSLDDSIVLIKGQENTLSIKMVNSGLSDAKFVYLTVNGPLGMKFLSSNEQYVGDLSSDDFETIDYSIFIEDSTPGNSNLQLTIKYKNSKNEDFTEIKTLPIRVYSQSEAKQLGLVKSSNYIFYVLVVIIILGFLYYRRRKKLKRKKKLE